MYIWLIAIILLGAAVWQGFKVWVWWKPRRGLVWPHRPDSWIQRAHWLRVAMESDESFSTPEFTPRWVDFLSDMDRRLSKASSEWNNLNAAGRLLYGFSQYEDAVWALEVAKSMDPFPEWLFSEKEGERQLLEEWHEVEEWHDANIAYILAHRG